VSTTVNHLHFWPVLNMEARHLGASAAQLEAISKLHVAVEDRSFLGNVFNELDVKLVEGILAVTVRECGDDMQEVVNGKWFTLAIEEDGYLVLTGSEVGCVMTGYSR